MIKEAIASLVGGEPLSASATEAVVEEIMTGQATQAQIAGFLVGLRMRGENADQVAAAARVMRRHALPVKVTRPGPILDTCGTGGDGLGTFNISTLASIVVAACGVTVAKHGNRAASSRCGSADVLEALGVDLEISPDRVQRCIDQVGIGFMFARTHHPAMRFAAPVRAELGLATLFNLLGPLSNPASATHQLMGVGKRAMQPLMASVLAQLPVQRAWVVCGDPALDEVSLSGPTSVIEVDEGKTREFSLTPADFGLSEAPIAALQGGSATDNAIIARAIFGGERGPRRDAVVINAAAALCVVQAAESPAAAAALAVQAIDDGRAAAVLSAWGACTRAEG